MGSFTFWLFIGLLILMIAKPSFLARFFYPFGGRGESAWPIQNAIAGAWISGAVLGIVMLILAIAGGYDSNILRDLVLSIVILGLALGIYKKSIVCSVMMFVFYVGDRIFTLWSDADNIRLVIAILFAYMFYQGVLGSFAYRQMARADYDRSSYYSGFESTSTQDAATGQDSMVACPQCGEQVQMVWQFCRLCGAALGQ